MIRQATQPPQTHQPLQPPLPQGAHLTNEHDALEYIYELRHKYQHQHDQRMQAWNKFIPTLPNGEDNPEFIKYMEELDDNLYHATHADQQPPWLTTEEQDA